MSQKRIQSIKGTTDILPDTSRQWQVLEAKLHQFMEKYGYKEIRTPAFENTSLFARGVGEETDIVSKEMYSWVDQGGTALTLKPELTAPVVRAFIQHNLDKLSPVTKLYYMDALFRRERPQKGRYRQFHQIGVEAFGSPHPEQDAEVIDIAWSFFQSLGLNNITLNLNSIGSAECRSKYRTALQDYLRPHFNELSETSQRRFETNPLRILDTKSPVEIDILSSAPKITDCHSIEDAQHFEDVKILLSDIGIPFTLNERMVRGLDYYTRTTFEITSSALGAQDAICGGGRYDNLVETLGGKSTPAIGFAAGVERIMLLIGSELVDSEPKNHVYIICLGDAPRTFVSSLSHTLRNHDISVGTDMLRRSMKAQMRDANRLGAVHAVIIGDDEFNNQTAIVKELETGTQSSVPFDQLTDYFLTKK